jgi:hypothetical protein
MVLFGPLFCTSSAELEQLILTRVKKLYVLLDIIHCSMAHPGGMFSHETYLNQLHKPGPSVERTLDSWLTQIGVNMSFMGNRQFAVTIAHFIQRFKPPSCIDSHH